MKQRRILLVLVALGTVASCGYSGPGLYDSNMPRKVDVEVTGTPWTSATSQAVLSSARHWELVAADVARGICDANNECRPPPPPSPPPPPRSLPPTPSQFARYARDGSGQSASCVSVGLEPDATQESKFSTVFSGAVVGELLANHVRVFKSNSPTICDRVELRATVVKLSGDQHTAYYAGQLTVLAEGIIVIRKAIRKVIEHGSPQYAAGALLLGETAYWLSPNYLTRHPMAEVTITVSRVTVAGQYVGQFTNVYYIDAKDVDAYKVPEHHDTGQGVGSSYLPATYHKPEVALPNLSGPPKSTVKTGFSGTRQFQAGGANKAFVIGSSSDGSEVVGSAQFPDGRWHVIVSKAPNTVTDYGTMGGFSAKASAVSGDGAEIVGRVQIVTSCPGQWVAFKLTLAADGSHTTELLGKEPRTEWDSVTSVVLSSSGTTVVANLQTMNLEPCGGPATPVSNRIVRWGGNGANDAFNQAFATWSDQNPVTAPTCIANGVSDDGSQIEFNCTEAQPSGPPVTRFFVFSEAAKKPIQPRVPNVVIDNVVGVSHDLSTISGTVLDSHGNLRASVSSLNDPNGRGAYGPVGFIPTGLSSDGNIVLGRVVSGPASGAALWYVADTKPDGGPSDPVIVFQPSAGPNAVTGQPLPCAAVVSDLSSGALVLVNQTNDPSGCGKESGDSAWLVAP